MKKWLEHLFKNFWLLSTIVRYNKCTREIKTFRGGGRLIKFWGTKAPKVPPANISHWIVQVNIRFDQGLAFSRIARKQCPPIAAKWCVCNTHSFFTILLFFLVDYHCCTKDRFFLPLEVLHAIRMLSNYKQINQLIRYGLVRDILSFETTKGAPVTPAVKVRFEDLTSRYYDGGGRYTRPKRYYYDDDGGGRDNVTIKLIYYYYC